MSVLLALSMAVVQAPVAPPYRGNGRIAFHCSLRDVAVTVLTKIDTVNQISVLTDFHNGSGAVSETYDPSSVMNGATFSRVLLSPNPLRSDSYIFLLETNTTVRGHATLLIRPDRDPVSGAPKTEFIGILGVTGADSPTHIGLCDILGGRRATDLFRSIHFWKAKKQ
jgi:hypothetical protein